MSKAQKLELAAKVVMEVCRALTKQVKAVTAKQAMVDYVSLSLHAVFFLHESKSVPFIYLH